MNANLVLLNGKGPHKTFALPNPVTVLGRRHDCNLRIPLPMVSRKHCQLSQNGDSMKLRDLSSRAGTFVNGKKVEAETEIPLKPGDYIRIGPLTFVCQIDGRPAQITPPPKTKKVASQPPKAKPKSEKPAAAPKDELGDELDKELDEKSADELDEKLGDELDDLDVSDSFINLDDLDADAEDLKDV
ncbi:MAG: FHA domain-containing protein [Phycisphaerales bacterium]